MARVGIVLFARKLAIVRVTFVNILKLTKIIFSILAMFVVKSVDLEARTEIIRIDANLLKSNQKKICVLLNMKTSWMLRKLRLGREERRKKMNFMKAVKSPVSMRILRRA